MFYSNILRLLHDLFPTNTKKEQPIVQWVEIDKQLREARLADLDNNPF